MVNKIVVSKYSDKINIQIWTNLDGKGFCYCGNGKFAFSEEEVRQIIEEFKIKYNTNIVETL